MNEATTEATATDAATAPTDAPQGASTPEATKEAPPEPARPAYASADELLADFADDLIVHKCEVQGREFFIKELDFYELLDVETKRLTVIKNQVQRNPAKETKAGFALEFSACLMKPNGGSYAPMFDKTTVQAFFHKPKAKELINDLAEKIYEINPAIDPLNRLRVAAAATGKTQDDSQGGETQ
jgi:hypothetical protein